MYWWKPEWQCPSDLLSRILAVPAKVALNIDQSFLYTHLVCVSRQGVLDIVIARILIFVCTCARSVNDRTKLLCLVFFFFFLVIELIVNPDSISIVYPHLFEPLPVTRAICDRIHVKDPFKSGFGVSPQFVSPFSGRTRIGEVIKIQWEFLF